MCTLGPSCRDLALTAKAQKTEDRDQDAQGGALPSQGILERAP